MAKIALSPHQLADNPKITLEIRRSGDSLVLFGMIKQKDLDELLAAGAELEDLEDSHDREDADYFED